MKNKLFLSLSLLTPFMASANYVAGFETQVAAKAYSMFAMPMPAKLAIGTGAAVIGTGAYLMSSKNNNAKFTANYINNCQETNMQDAIRFEDYANIKSGIELSNKPMQKDKNSVRAFGSSATSTVQAHPYISTGAGLTVAAGLGYLAYTKYVAKKAAAVKAAAAKVVTPTVKPVVAQPAPMKEKTTKRNVKKSNGRVRRK